MMFFVCFVINMENKIYFKFSIKGKYESILPLR